jgi:hypothetical protein
VRIREEYHKFQVSLGYVVRHFSWVKKKRKEKKVKGRKKAEEEMKRRET